MAIVRWGHETQIADIDWLWEPMIPYGKVTIVGGDGGNGKTTLILTVAAMLSRGTPPPTLRDGHLYDATPREPITTFYLTNEDEIADSSLKRYERAGGDTSRFAYSGELDHHVMLTQDELQDIVDQTHARLIIVDPFQAFLPEGTNLGNITRMRSIFTMLANFTKTTGVAIVLVGHLNKNEGGKDIHRGFGSADIAASVRSILLVEMDKHRNRFVRAIKSNFDESDYSPIQLVFDEERRLSFKEVDPDEEMPMVETKINRAISILKTLLSDSPMPVSEINEIMEEEGIGAKTAQRARAKIGAVQFYDQNIPYWRQQ